MKLTDKQVESLAKQAHGCVAKDFVRMVEKEVLNNVKQEHLPDATIGDLTVKHKVEADLTDPGLPGLLDKVDKLHTYLAELVQAHEKNLSLASEKDELQRRLVEIQQSLELEKEPNQRYRLYNLNLNDEIYLLKGQVRTLKEKIPPPQESWFW